MICVIVEISAAPGDLARLVDDADTVYADIFEKVPGFLFGSLAVRREDHHAVGVFYYESAEAWHAAEPVVEGVREAVKISPGVTFTTVDYEVVTRLAGLEARKLLAPIDGTAAPGAPV